MVSLPNNDVHMAVKMLQSACLHLEPTLLQGNVELNMKWRADAFVHLHVLLPFVHAGPPPPAPPPSPPSTGPWKPIDASASDDWSGTYRAIFAVDGHITTYWQTAYYYMGDTGEYNDVKHFTIVDGNRVEGEWLTVNMPAPLFLSSYTLRPAQLSYNYGPCAAPGVFKIVGSNDGGNSWTLVHDYTAGWNGSSMAVQSYTVDPAPTQAFKWFRLVVIKPGAAGCVFGWATDQYARAATAIAEWRLYGLTTNAG